jgi:hypothetical protein
VEAIDNFESIIKAARQGHEPVIIDVAENTPLDVMAPVAFVPTDGGGFALANVKPFIDAYRERPERRTGTAKLDDLASFIAHTNRFKDDDSAIFVSGDPARPSFLSVLDYHEAVNGPSEEKRGSDPEPRFGQHRGAYVPVFSDEWKAWTGVAGKGLSQADFASLIESRARDIFDVNEMDDVAPEEGSPSRLGEMARWFSRRFARGKAPSEFYATAETMLVMAEGLTATVTDRVGDIAKRDSGGTRITFESDRATDVEIPAAFVIEVPVFRGGNLWQLPVRLRYALRQAGDTKRAEWRIEPFGVERTVADVVKDMGETVQKATGLPVFVGAPE